MAKDPAILLYTADFIVGTLFMTYEQKGKYIDLLCAQHQHGGSISKKDFDAVVGDDATLRSKFIETNEGYFNERLLIEMNKRSAKSSKLRENALSMWESKQKESKTEAKTKQLQSNCIAIAVQSENENENENIIDNCINAWNIFAEKHSLVRVIKITDKRKRSVLARLKDKDFNLEHIFSRIEESDFLLGKNKQGWKIHFDFIFTSANNYVKILEGNYGKNRNNSNSSADELKRIVERRRSKEQQQ